MAKKMKIKESKEVDLALFDIKTYYKSFTIKRVWRNRPMK